MVANRLPARSAAGIHDSSELLRFSTAGSVDDGKSTLIGRLLYDTKTAFEDQLSHVADVSRRRGDARTNLALLTDGLRAEREQGITIDVAYRYFSTTRRKFIIADTPGHKQYTRNMVTGASTAGLSIVLVDARTGLVEQSRRHALIAGLLGIPQLVFAVNKMDLVGWDEQVFRRIEQSLGSLGGAAHTVAIPISALTGANVVERGSEMPWYAGPTLLEHLEEVPVDGDLTGGPARFPVQWVIRPQSAEHPDYRGYAGQVAGGVLRVGDEIAVLPGGRRSRISRLEQAGEPVDEAVSPMSVTVHLADDLDVGRGDLICAIDQPAVASQELTAMVCWMADRPLQAGGRYALKHTTRWTRAIVTDIVHEIDVNTGARSPASELALNALGRIAIKTTSPIAVDPYEVNRTTGSFILVDEATNATVAAGMICTTT